MGKKHLLLAATLCAGVLPMAPWSAVPADAELAYPSAWESFPECATLDQEFCVESLEFTPAGSSTAEEFDDPAYNSASPTGKPTVRAAIQGTYTGPSTPGALFFYPLLEVRIVDAAGETAAYGYSDTSPTKTGLEDGLYKAVVRTGDLDPAYMLLQGQHESYSISRGTDGNYTVTFSGRPTVFVDVSYDRWATCDANNWLASCESNRAFRYFLSARFVMLRDASNREASRGGWFATNAAKISVLPKLGAYDITLAGPHFAPDDFGDTSVPKENGRSVNPAYFAIFMPYKGIASGVSKTLGVPIDAEMVKAFLIKHKSEMVTGTIKVANSPTAIPVELPRGLKLELLDEGVLADFNLTHFSAPNPKVKSRLPSSRAVKTLKNGAVIGVVSAAARGKTLSGSNLYIVSAGGKVTKVVSTTPKVCTALGTSVKTLKSGTCKVTLSVKKGLSMSSYSASIKVK